ncbi:P-loop containing nucleoside triphosphate hydrolase protein [Pavlovales sp. CCMP2436]|nr:P-loop containing nucleoside triphosphate hydrolase protein [Pavlovales sp. CCMP2436]
MPRAQKLYDDDDLDYEEEEYEEYEEEASPRRPPSLHLSGLSLGSPKPQPAARKASAGTPSAPRASPAEARAARAAAPAPRALQLPPPPATRVLNLVVVGHVDAGKSTLSGRLLVECGVVSAQSIGKLKREAAQANKGSFAYAWVLDEDASERARGITVDVARAQLKTQSYDVNLLDTPGHRDFVPEMISGAAQADAALLVTNASPGEFEKGLNAQTREHITLCRSLGVRNALVVVNQMDKVAYSQQAFERLMAELAPVLAAAGFPPASVRYVPCAAFHGDNVTRPSEQLPWWGGPSVRDAIEALPPPRRDTASPARATVLDCYKSRLAGGGALTLLVRVNAGALRPKDQLLLLPAGELVVVKALAVGGEPAAALVDGECGEVAVAPAGGGGSTLEVLSPQPGWVLSAAHAPAALATEIEARVQCLQLRRPLVKGDVVELHSHCALAPAVVSRIVCLLDARGAVVPTPGADGGKGRPRCLRSAEHAIIRVRLSEGPICIETFGACAALSRFSLRAGSETLLVGAVTAIVS